MENNNGRRQFIKKATLGLGALIMPLGNSIAQTFEEDPKNEYCKYLQVLLPEKTVYWKVIANDTSGTPTLLSVHDFTIPDGYSLKTSYFEIETGNGKIEQFPQLKIDPVLLKKTGFIEGNMVIEFIDEHAKIIKKNCSLKVCFMEFNAQKNTYESINNCGEKITSSNDNEIAFDSVIIYPNPVSVHDQLLSLKLSPAFQWESARIANILGQQYQHFDLQYMTSLQNLSLAQLPPGTYTITCTTKGGNSLSKLFLVQ